METLILQGHLAPLERGWRGFTVAPSIQLPFDTRLLLRDSGERHEFMVNIHRDQEVCLRRSLSPSHRHPTDSEDSSLSGFFFFIEMSLLPPWHAKDARCRAHDAQYFDLENHCLKSPHTRPSSTLTNVCSTHVQGANLILPGSKYFTKWLPSGGEST